MLVRRLSSAALGLILVLCFTLAALTGASPAYADPSCRNGGALILFAKGSGAPYNSDEARSFFAGVQAGLADVPTASMELEYPAVGIDGWLPRSAGVSSEDNDLVGYMASRLTGSSNLYTFLSNRYANGACPGETLILGGYSQGAHVLGFTLNLLSSYILRHIGFAALYGDPRFNRGNLEACQSFQPNPPWYRGNSNCTTNVFGVSVFTGGILGPRGLYLPSDLVGRYGSWCDVGDIICTTNTAYAIEMLAGTSAHYRYDEAGGWIQQSMTEIVSAARSKIHQLNPPPTSPPPGSSLPGAGQKLAATKNQDGRLGLFYVGGDSAIYYQYQLNPGGWWGTEKRIPAYAKGIAATTSLDGRIELFYIGGDNAIYHRYQTAPSSDSWSAEERFNVGALGISAARNGAGRIELVIIGMNRALYIVEQQAVNSWSGGAMNGSEWQHIPSWAGDVAMTTASDGRNEIFYVGSTGVLMHRWQGAVGDSYPHEEGFSANIVKVAATRNQDGRLEVFSVGTNAHLYNKWQWQPNTPWYHTWDQRVGQARYLTAARNHDGRLELFHVGLNNRLYHQWQNNPGAGQGWSTESLMYGSVAP